MVAPLPCLKLRVAPRLAYWRMAACVASSKPARARATNLASRNEISIRSPLQQAPPFVAGNLYVVCRFQLLQHPFIASFHHHEQVGHTFQGVLSKRSLVDGPSDRQID